MFRMTYSGNLKCIRRVFNYVGFDLNETEAEKKREVGDFNGKRL